MTGSACWATYKSALTGLVETWVAAVLHKWQGISVTVETSLLIYCEIMANDHLQRKPPSSGMIATAKVNDLLTTERVYPINNAKIASYIDNILKHSTNKTEHLYILKKCLTTYARWTRYHEVENVTLPWCKPQCWDNHNLTNSYCKQMPAL